MSFTFAYFIYSFSESHNAHKITYIEMNAKLFADVSNFASAYASVRNPFWFCNVAQVKDCVFSQCKIHNSGNACRSCNNTIQIDQQNSVINIKYALNIELYYFNDLIFEYCRNANYHYSFIPKQTIQSTFIIALNGE